MSGKIAVGGGIPKTTELERHKLADARSMLKSLSRIASSQGKRGASEALQLRQLEPIRFRLFLPQAEQAAQIIDAAFLFLLLCSRVLAKSEAVEAGQRLKPFLFPRPPILPQLDSRSLYLVVVLRPPLEAMHLGQIIFTECFGQ
jgi:hypothetical protein